MFIGVHRFLFSKKLTERILYLNSILIKHFLKHLKVYENVYLLFRSDSLDETACNFSESPIRVTSGPWIEIFISLTWLKMCVRWAKQFSRWKCSMSGFPFSFRTIETSALSSKKRFTACPLESQRTSVREKHFKFPSHFLTERLTKCDDSESCFW